MTKPTTSSSGMALPELRQHIAFARRGAAVHVAFALGADGQPIVMLDKRKPPRAMVKQIKDGSAGSKNHRFGTLAIDTEEPTLARLVIDKPSAGMAKRLAKSLKGTGVRKIVIMLEDGSEAENAATEEDEDEAGDESGRDTDNEYDAEDDEPEFDSDADAPEAQQADAPEDMPQQDAEQAPEQQAEAMPDAHALAARLTTLVKRMIGVIAQDPSAKTALAELATDAQRSLKSGDLRQAAAGIDILEQALLVSAPGPVIRPRHPDAAAQGPVIKPRHPGAPAAPAMDAHAHKARERYGKSRKAWLATRARIDGEIKKLHGAIMKADHGGTFGDELEQSFLQAVDPVLDTLDESLSETLAKAEHASPAEAEALIKSCREMIGRYKKFVATNPVISSLDNNPFVPVAIGSTLSASLTTLEGALR